MRKICGEESYISPFVRVLNDDNACYILYVTWSKRLLFRSLIVKESGFPRALVDECLSKLHEIGFVSLQEGMVYTLGMADLLLGTMGFEKQELTLSQGLSIDVSTVSQPGAHFDFNSRLIDDDSRNDDASGLPQAA